jgi:choloylglycine hydrolase
MVMRLSVSCNCFFVVIHAMPPLIGDLYLHARRCAEAVFFVAAMLPGGCGTLAPWPGIKEPVMQILKSLAVTALLIGSLLLGLLVAAANACTGIRLTAADGTVVQARTLEFGVDVESSVIVVPRGYERTGTTPDGKPGIKWSSKYACVGASGLGLPIMLDGVNEKGLSAGLFYFPGTAGYMPYTTAAADQTLAPWELGSWILENCATTDEAKSAVTKLVVPEVVLKAWGFCPGAHYVVVDASGAAIVIEYVDGQLHVYDDPLGVITNNPTFDWHMTNLRNYIKFTPTGAPPLVLDGVKLTALGEGSGMLGMPGDFTPPSRFVRAVAYSQSAEPVDTGEEAVLQAFHILNNFDIPKGSVLGAKDTHGNVVAEETQWTSVCDLKAKKFYFRTHANSQLRSVELGAINTDGGEIQAISMQGDEVIQPLLPTGEMRKIASGQ